MNKIILIKSENDTCIVCGFPLGRNSTKYCSFKCQSEKEYREYISRWKSGLEKGMKGSDGISDTIKRYLRDKYNNACQKCGWKEINPTTGSVPVTVNHIDGDCTNNKEDNLELLCPNCHSLTSNFGRLNKNCKRKRSVGSSFNGRTSGLQPDNLSSILSDSTNHAIYP